MLMSLLTVMFTVEVCHQATDRISSMLLSVLFWFQYCTNIDKNHLCEIY